MNKQEYLFLSSLDSLDTFPNNNASSFRVELPKALDLKGKWQVALTDITYWPQFRTEERPRELYCLLDIVDESYVQGSSLKCLRRLSITEDNIKININFDNLYYVNVISSYISTLHFYILDENLLAPSFADKQLYCTLHLKKLS